MIAISSRRSWLRSVLLTALATVTTLAGPASAAEELRKANEVKAVAWAKGE